MENAKLLWLNARAAQTDPAFHVCGKNLESYGRHILDACSKVVVDNSSAEDFAICDRYGGIGIGGNGGAGRAGFIGGYYVKGIGCTPLIGQKTPTDHTTGGAYLEECAREAVMSEILSRELPHGVIPVLAILDSGEKQVWHTDMGDKSERRCLLVRPPFIRPAHFERAPMFIGKNAPGGWSDVQRLAKMYEGFVDSGEIVLNHYNVLWLRWARQLGYSYAARITHGGCVSSNVCISGALVDFGGAAAVPSLAQYFTGGGTTGNDLKVLVEFAANQFDSLGRYFGVKTQPGRLTGAIEKLSLAYRRAVGEAQLSVLGLTRRQRLELLQTKDAEQIVRSLTSFIKVQSQRHGSIYQNTNSAEEKQYLAENFWYSSEERTNALRELICRNIPEISDQAVLRLIIRRNSYRARARRNIYRDILKVSLYDKLDGGYPDVLPPANVSRVLNYEIASASCDHEGVDENDGMARIGVYRGDRYQLGIYVNAIGDVYARTDWVVSNEVKQGYGRVRHLSDDFIETENGTYENGTFGDGRQSVTNASRP